MAKTGSELEEQIALLRDLLDQAAALKDEPMKLNDHLALLDSVGRAAPQLARLIKAQRELEGGGDDPMAVLRQALEELEEEWPELKECKEGLRNGEMPISRGPDETRTGDAETPDKAGGRPRRKP